MIRIIYLLLFFACTYNLYAAAGAQGVRAFNRANEYYSSGQYRKAIIMYRKARGSGVDPSVCSFNIGNCYFQAGDLPAAAAAYRSAVSAESTVRADALLNLGGVLYRLDSFGEAIAAYRRGLLLDSDNLSAWLYLAEAYEKTGDNVQALHALERAHELQPDDVSIVYQMAEAYIALREIPQAITLVQTAYTLRPDETDFLFYIADLRVMARDTSGAISAYREALSAEPENYNAHYRIADILVAHNQPFLAMEHLATALKIKSDFTDAAVFLGNLTFDLRWWDRAIAAYRQAYLHDDDEGVLGTINIIYRFIEQKNLQEARTLFNQIDALNPEDPSLAADLEKLGALVNSDE